MVFQGSLPVAGFFEVIWEESAVMSRLQLKHLLLNNVSNILDSVPEKKFSAKKKKKKGSLQKIF